jgi:hypothetical protein
MARFAVTVGRDRSEYTTVEVEAEHEAIAMERARNVARSAPDTLNWTLDRESIIGEPYVACKPELVEDDPR